MSVCVRERLRRRCRTFTAALSKPKISGLISHLKKDNDLHKFALFINGVLVVVVLLLLL